MKAFQQEVDTMIAESIVNTELEQEVAREFKECKSDMVRNYTFTYVL